jgi:hypothetical protein
MRSNLPFFGNEKMSTSSAGCPALDVDILKTAQWRYPGLGWFFSIHRKKKSTLKADARIGL